MISGGIDLGGTKIEARLFDAELNTLDMRRVPTPSDDFGSFIDALTAQLRWLEQGSGRAAALPVGVALPGMVDTRSGRAFAANIPVSGHDLPRSLAAAFGRPVPLINDAQAFALSEAHSGAGAGMASVVGLIMGTGIGAGHALSGALPHRQGGSALEIGHVGLPAALAQRLGLPLRACGCGASGCFETVLSGPGLSWLARQHLGAEVTPAELGSRAASGEPGAEAVLALWAEVAGELLRMIQLAQDPDVIVLGGGLSRIDGIEARLSAALERARLGALRPPLIRTALHGDSSGARGAALQARALATTGGAASAGPAAP